MGAGTNYSLDIYATKMDQGGGSRKNSFPSSSFSSFHREREELQHAQGGEGEEENLGGQAQRGFRAGGGGERESGGGGGGLVMPVIHVNLKEGAASPSALERAEGGGGGGGGTTATAMAGGGGGGGGKRDLHTQSTNQTAVQRKRRVSVWGVRVKRLDWYCSLVLASLPLPHPPPHHTKLSSSKRGRLDRPRHMPKENKSPYPHPSQYKSLVPSVSFVPLNFPCLWLVSQCKLFSFF